MSKEMVQDDWKKVKELRSEVYETDREWAVARKVEYIKTEIQELSHDIIDDYYSYLKSYRAGRPLAERLSSIKFRETDKKEKKLRRLKQYLTNLQQDSSKKGIEGYDIAQARSFPITQVVENVHRGLWTNCPDPGHPGGEDRHPSMYLKNNFAYCFVCNKAYDTIDLAMLIYDFSFKEAVEFLNKGGGV